MAAKPKRRPRRVNYLSAMRNRNSHPRALYDSDMLRLYDSGNNRLFAVR